MLEGIRKEKRGGERRGSEGGEIAPRLYTCFPFHYLYHFVKKIGKDRGQQLFP